MHTDIRKYQAKVKEAAGFLQTRIKQTPKLAILTGTGLSDFLTQLRVHTSIPYKDIPHFPVSTVKSHLGNLLAGELGNMPVALFQGRFHLYEGYTPKETGFPVRVMAEMGVQTLVITNAAGGLNLDYSPGDIMLIQDHINLTGKNPLSGENTDAFGPRFPDMSEVYDRNLLSKTRNLAEKNQIPHHTGVYIGLSGPSLETPAETRFIRMIGGDAVGFSTVTEAITAVHAGMKIMGISVITNVNDPDKPKKVSLEEVISVSKAAAPGLALLIQGILA